MKYMHEVAFTAFLNIAIPSSSLRGSDGSVGTNTVTLSAGSEMWSKLSETDYTFPQKAFLFLNK